MYNFAREVKSSFTASTLENSESLLDKLAFCTVHTLHQCASTCTGNINFSLLKYHLSIRGKLRSRFSVSLSISTKRKNYKKKCYRIWYMLAWSIQSASAGCINFNCFDWAIHEGIALPSSSMNGKRKKKTKRKNAL